MISSLFLRLVTLTIVFCIIMLGIIVCCRSMGRLFVFSGILRVSGFILLLIFVLFSIYLSSCLWFVLGRVFMFFCILLI